MTKRRRRTRSKSKWRRVDLHLHTPASADYQEPQVSYLDILRQAESKGLDVIAFTDHNTAAGYRAMIEEIKQLELLEQLGRLRKEEEKRLRTYRRLREKGIIEVSVTPFYHPILPLIYDTNFARRCMPDCDLPRIRFHPWVPQEVGGVIGRVELRAHEALKSPPERAYALLRLEQGLRGDVAECADDPRFYRLNLHQQN